MQSKESQSYNSTRKILVTVLENSRTILTVTVSTLEIKGSKELPGLRLDGMFFKECFK